MDLTAGHVPTGGSLTADDQKTDVALARLIEHYRFPEGYRRMFLAAIAAFSEKGFHGTSTRDIAARAGMSPAALYVHFGSKEEVLYRIAISAIGLTQEVMTTADIGGDRPSQRLRSVVRAITAWHAHHSAAARVVLYQLDALSPEHRAEVTERERVIDQIIRQIVADGISAGEFSMTDSGTAATAVLSLCMDVARWYRPNHRHSPEEIGEYYAEAALRIVGVREP
ncbi:MAG: TetR/AcrR family transcriptional regulator [Actinomycetota bacterium]